MTQAEEAVQIMCMLPKGRMCTVCILYMCKTEEAYCLVVHRIHVRRTDKVGAEAAFHSIDEYMAHVEDYYKTLEKRQHFDQRRVYIATDDASVIDEAKRKYVKLGRGHLI